MDPLRPGAKTCTLPGPIRSRACAGRWTNYGISRRNARICRNRPQPGNGAATRHHKAALPGKSGKTACTRRKCRAVYPMTSGLLRFAFGIGGVALFLTAGLGLSELLTALRRRPLPTRLAYSYLLGVAYVAGAMYVSSHFLHLGFGRRVILSIVFVPGALGLIHWLCGRHRVARDLKTGYRSWRHAIRDPLLGVVTAVGILVSLGVLIDAMTNPVTDADGRITWCLQAKYVRAEQSVTPRVLREPQWYVWNRGYPLLLPLAQVAIQQVVTTNEDERVFRPVYAAFFPVSLLIVYEGAARLAGRRLAATAVLMASTVPFLAFWSNGGAPGTYSDFPLACFFSAGILLLFDDRNLFSSAIAAGALLAACVLTKQEGLVLAVVAVAAGSVMALPLVTRRVRPQRATVLMARLALAGLAVLSALALRMSWSARIPATMEDFVTPLSKVSTYIEFFPRLFRAAPEMVSETFNPQKWSIFWAVAALAFIAGRRALRYQFCRILLLVALAPLAVGCVAYGIHPNPGWLARHTWSRFLAQASLLILVVLPFFIRQAIGGAFSPSVGPAGLSFSRWRFGRTGGSVGSRDELPLGRGHLARHHPPCPS